MDTRIENWGVSGSAGSPYPSILRTPSRERSSSSCSRDSSQSVLSPEESLDLQLMRRRPGAPASGSRMGRSTTGDSAPSDMMVSPSAWGRQLGSSAIKISSPDTNTSSGGGKTDNYIGYRANYVDEDTWERQKMLLDESPFLERPTMEELITARVASGRNLPRTLQSWQVVMRAGWRGPGAAYKESHLAFFKDQDSAFKDLLKFLKSPATFADKPRPAVRKKQALHDKAGRPLSLKPKKPQPAPRPAPVSLAPDTGSRTKSSAARSLKRPLQEVSSQLPRVKVRADDEVWVDGVPLRNDTRVYARVFGLAYAEKVNAGWKVGPGLVDRCYYIGPKSQAKARPGDFFPSDAALLADFVRRRPDVLMEVDKL